MMRRLLSSNAPTRMTLAALAMATVLAQPVQAETAAQASEPLGLGTLDGLPITLSGSYLAGRLAGQTNDLANAAAGGLPCSFSFAAGSQG